jgi:hypothetical protein
MILQAPDCGSRSWTSETMELPINKCERLIFDFSKPIRTWGNLCIWSKESNFVLGAPTKISIFGRKVKNSFNHN